MGLDAGLAGASLVGNLVGGGKASSAQNNATNQATQEQNQVMSMVNNFINQATPTIQGLVQQLQGWSGLKPQELTALTANAAASGNSDIQTAQSRGAFGANQNAAIGSALTQNQQTSELAASNVGAAAASQELSALQSIPSAENVLNPSNAGGGLLTGLSGQNQSYAEGIGNAWAPASSSLGSLGSILQNGKSTSTASNPYNSGVLSSPYGWGGYSPATTSTGGPTDSSASPLSTGVGGLGWS